MKPPNAEQLAAVAAVRSRPGTPARDFERLTGHGPRRVCTIIKRGLVVLGPDACLYPPDSAPDPREITSEFAVNQLFDEGWANRPIN